MKPGHPGYWEWRKKTGRKKAIKNPKELWVLACEYFEQVDETPFLKNELIKGGDLAGRQAGVETMRPYTWTGLEDYLLSRGKIGTLSHYKANLDNRYTEFVAIIRDIERIIYTRKFDGATVNAFNANIIARDLGLIDKQSMSIPEMGKIKGITFED